MYASFRRYRMGAGSMDDAMHLVDTEFADRLAEEPGFVDYQVVATGDDMIVSMTIFEDEEQCLASNDMAAEFVRAPGAVPDRAPRGLRRRGHGQSRGREGPPAGASLSICDGAARDGHAPLRLGAHSAGRMIHGAT